MHDGVITKHSFNRENDKSISLDGRIRREDLKRYLLYWDKIIYPVVNGLGPNLDFLPGLQHLEKNGILLLEEVSLTTNHLHDEHFDGVIANGRPITPAVLAEAQVKIAQSKLDAGETWSIAQTGDYFAMPSATKRNYEIKSLVFSLFNCLPIPGNSVSYEDIIDFRISNKEPLLQLHRLVENYKRSVCDSQDPQRELVLAMKDLTLAAEGVSSLMQAKKWSFSFESFKSYMEISENSLAASAIGALSATELNLPPQAGAVAGYAASIGLNVIQQAIQGHENIPEALRGYLYLYNASKGGIL